VFPVAFDPHYQGENIALKSTTPASFLLHGREGTVLGDRALHIKEALSYSWVRHVLNRYGGCYIIFVDFSSYLMNRSLK